MYVLSFDKQTFTFNMFIYFQKALVLFHLPFPSLEFHPPVFVVNNIVPAVRILTYNHLL